MGEITKTRAKPASPPSRAAAAAYVQEIFQREMGVTLHNAKVGSPRDQAMRELTKATANLYARRVLRELIQNAFDGAASADAPRILVRLDLREAPYGTLYVANTGQGFTTSNVDAISNPAMSNKKPGNFIGHKGLGFRSVELLSDDPQIYSSSGHGGDGFDGYCFRFARPEDERSWLESANAADFAEVVVGRTHHLQLPIPIDEDPEGISAFTADGYCTVVRLPLRDAFAQDRVIEEMRGLVDEKAPLTLFLDRLSSLTLERIDAGGRGEVKVFRRSARPCHRAESSAVLRVEEATVDRRRFLIARLKVDEAGFRASVERSVEEKHPVEKWLEWEGAPVVSVALPLGADARPGIFYAFLPMERPAPFNGCLDAPFFPDADRKDLDLAIPLNAFLLDSVADLCLALAQAIADANAHEFEAACAAVDAFAWSGDPVRLQKACERAGRDVGGLSLPAERRKCTVARWAPLEEIFDWDDEAFAIIDARWLVRVCDVPMLRRKLGDCRHAALASFVDAVDYTFQPDPSNWQDWAPALVADLASRKKTVRQDWEAFYADLSRMPEALAHLRGHMIFRTQDGTLAAANGAAAAGQRELYISPDPDNAVRTRKRLAGTTIFPPASIARRMEFADPALSWQPAVTKALFGAGLAHEYSLPKVIAGLGRLLGSRPRKADLVSAVSWAFGAWKAHKTPELEAALRQAGLQVPRAGGGFGAATQTRFGTGWRDTHGDLLAEFCACAPEGSRAVKLVQDSLLMPWDQWPQREKGTVHEWVQFLRLLGVKDGLPPISYKAVTLPISAWCSVRRPADRPLHIEKAVGGEWRRALQSDRPWKGVAYVSGEYSTDDTLFAFPMQQEHAAMSDRAKRAYARLLLHQLEDLPARFLSTVLRRTAGNRDTVMWPSPLLAFLCEAEWLPVSDGEQTMWAKPVACWFAPRSEPFPRFLPRIEKGVRDILEASKSVRTLFQERLGLRLWTDPASAVDRLAALGAGLAAGRISEVDHDGYRKAYGEAWLHWHDAADRLPLPAGLILAVQAGGRLVPLAPGSTDGEVVYVGDGADPLRENLLMALGYRLLSVPSGTAHEVVAALADSGTAEFRQVAEVQPTILMDGAPLQPAAQLALLAGEEREWLAEIAVLALEFHSGGPANRSTAKSRQALYDSVRRLRVAFARSVSVEVGGRAGGLPPELDGVLPVPDSDHPTVVVESGDGVLDWPCLARMAGGIALALNKAWLINDFRAAVLAIAYAQPGAARALSCPSDETLARAFAQRPERIREVRRSLRAASRSLFDWFIPAVHVLIGAAAAASLLEKEHLLADDGEILNLIADAGGQREQAQRLLELCRDAASLDEVRRELGIDVRSFNAALMALGSSWKPLNFKEHLQQIFAERVAERRAALEERVRDAYLATYDAGQPLTAYAAARSLAWISFDDAWSEAFDDLTDEVMDARIEDLAAKALPPLGGPADGLLDVVRQHNRSLIMRSADQMRRLANAWVAKDPGIRVLPPVWRDKSEQLVRDCLVAGVLDFRRLDETRLPQALDQAKLWPVGMPLSMDLGTLGLDQDDLDGQAQQERQAREADLRRKRSVTVGNVSIDGGTEEALQLVAEALRGALTSKAFRERSGQAHLRPFPDGGGGHAPGRANRTGKRARDPEYLSQEQRGLIGFAGEFAAYEYLKKKVRQFADQHWVSSMGRTFLCLPPEGDDHGYDFHVPRSRGGLYFEVKAHLSDPGYVDLGSSQVAAAVRYADGRKGIWSILYVAHALEPDLVTVHELVNPFGEEARNLYRPSNSQGVRLMIDHQ